uniref:Preprotein translocase subunit SecY n=1 Tax=Rhodogorgon sp. TaxID=2485824 RepID=A0A3G3MIK6_9FLOR|nr:preprotein translocase subunit SecY [Rhodogorgon sp.]
MKYMIQNKSPFLIYTEELLMRIIYILISYVICLLIFFKYINFIFLFEVYPFIVISYKKFISTQVTDLLNTVWLLIFFMSSIFTFPLTSYHISFFLLPSWYSYQFELFEKLIYGTYFFSFFFFFLFHFKILPEILSFLSYWEMKDSGSLLKIEIEARILLYVKWILNISFIFSYTISTLGFLLLSSIYLIKTSNFYYFLQTKKKVMIFFTVFIMFIFLPPDFFSQITLIFFIIFFYEVLFIIVCIRFYQLNFYN